MSASICPSAYGVNTGVSARQKRPLPKLLIGAYSATFASSDSNQQRKITYTCELCTMTESMELLQQGHVLHAYLCLAWSI
jgi:hypothetical protein